MANVRRSAAAALCLCFFFSITARAQHRPADSSAQLATTRALDELKQLLLEQKRELEAQRQLLREQQARIEELQRAVLEARGRADSAALQVAAAAGAAQEVAVLSGQLEAVAESQHQLAGRVTQTQAELAAANRSAESRFRQLGNFRFSGDIRFRYESFFQAQQTTRQRQRIRARLNLVGNLTDELFGGISFASGLLTDPISTNQDLTGFFNRKPVGFDRYFIEYTPKWLGKHATFGFGKFAFPWVRTSLTFDPDTNPEGIYARTNWDFKHPVFKGLTLVGFHLPVLERNAVTNPVTGQRANALDAFLAGGQLQTRWQLGDRLRLGLHFAGVNVINADFIAQAHATGGLTGNVPNTNSLRTDASGAVVGFASRFTYLDVVSTLSVNTGRPRWPLDFSFNFVNNTRARNIVQNGTAAPTAVLPNRERSAYQAEAVFGRLAERGDLQFSYTFARIERDALIAAFTESDRRAGTNLIQHRLNFALQFMQNVTANVTFWVGRLANAQDNIALVPGGKRAVPGGPCNLAPYTGCKDNFLKRTHLELIYRF
jgi:hypothetical protein